MEIAPPRRRSAARRSSRLTEQATYTSPISATLACVGTQPEIMNNAAIRLLGLNTPQVKQQAEDIIFGQLRQVIASMRIDDINKDRDKFLQAIQHSVEPELKKIGLVLINVNITDIQDESGYIDAIGQKAAPVDAAIVGIIVFLVIGRCADSWFAKPPDVAAIHAENELHARERAAAIPPGFVTPTTFAELVATLRTLTGADSVLAPDGLVVLEHARRQMAPGSAGRLVVTLRLVSGDSALAFYQRHADVRKPEPEI